MYLYENKNIYYFINNLNYWSIISLGALDLCKLGVSRGIIRDFYRSNSSFACHCIYSNNWFPDCERNRYARKDVPIGKKADGVIRE